MPKVRQIMPFLMRSRTESVVYFEQTLDVSAALEWLRRWHAAGGDRASLFNLVLYCLAKLLHERPRLNRFVAGRRIYQRDGVFVSFAAKKRMTDDAPISMVKRRVEPSESFADLTSAIGQAVDKARSDTKSSVDNELDVLLALPGPLLDVAVGLVRRLDGLGALPAAFTGPDPMFSSAVVSNLGSLKIDAAFHHLYEYGNCPLFLTVGIVRPTPVASGDGTVVVRPQLTLRWTFDERIEDGLYAGNSAELLRRWVEDPFSHLGDPAEGGGRQPMAGTAGKARPELRPEAQCCGVHQVDAMGALYLAAEDDRTTTHTAALVTIDPAAGPVPLDALRALVGQRLHLIPPFRRRLATVPFGLDHPYWYEDPEFDLDRHVREVTLPQPADDAVLRAEVARLFARPLDRSRPLWEMYLVSGLAGGRQAILTKVHHAAVDGVSGMQVLAALFDAGPQPTAPVPQPPEAGPQPPGPGPQPPGPGPQPPAARSAAPARPPSGLEMLARGIAGLAARPVQVIGGLPALLADVDEVPMLRSLPGAATVGRIARALQGRQRTFVHGPDLARAPRTAFNGRITADRLLGLVTLPLDDVKLVKNASGATVNDVVLALSAAAIRRWLIEHGQLPAAPLTAVVPVSTRASGEAGGFGNRVSAVFVPIPTDTSDGRRRIDRANEVMIAAKAHLATLPPNVLADATRMFPPVVLATAAHLVTAAAATPGMAPAVNVNISNVRGPQSPLYCAGARIESIMPLAGISDGMGLNITVMSYCGQLNVGVVADPAQMPDVQRIADWMADDLADLVRAEPTARGIA